MSTVSKPAVREPKQQPERPEPSVPALTEIVRQQLIELGEDPGRNGLVRTPDRVARSLVELTSGYAHSVEEVVGQGVFEEQCSEMVVVKDIEFYSLCEHHMLPFFGRVHVAYVPNGRVVGLSKIPRLVEMFARRLQVQERLTTQIAETLESVLEPKGVAVVGEAIHLCMMMRGVEQQNSSAVTSSMRGAFKSDSKTRSEFMDLIRHKRGAFA